MPCFLTYVTMCLIAQHVIMYEKKAHFIIQYSPPAGFTIQHSLPPSRRAIHSQIIGIQLLQVLRGSFAFINAVCAVGVTH